jgi:Fe-S cluster assembly protein SufD
MSTLTPAKWQPEDLADLCENEAIRQLALTRIKKLGLPNAKMEHYRYFGIVPLFAKHYRFHKQSVQPLKESDTLEIENGELVAAPSDIAPRLLKMQSIADNHYDPIYYISHMLTPEVIEIRIRGEKALTLKHRFTSEGALIAYRIKIVVEAGASLLLDEQFDDNLASGTLALYGMDIEVEEGASLSWFKDQEAHEQSAAMIASHAIGVEPKGSCKMGTFDFGSSRILHNYRIALQAHAKLDASHLLYGDKEGQRGNIVVIEHIGEHASTTQNAKHILKDSARGIFDGLIRVDHSGKYAVTHQNARSVLLDNGAYMISKPQLEIYIDELEASHGSTTGQLNPDQIFYLRSRGIEESEARKILIFAFAKDVIETIGNEAIETRLIEKFEKRYHGDAA